jgi:hypothetical protein
MNERFKNKIIEKNTILTRITYQNNRTSFCDYSEHYEKIENCTEAIMKKENGVIVINCTKCDINNTLTYHIDTNSNICRYMHYEKNCVVKYCKTCRTANNYFCEACLPTNYEVNKITGSCVKKTEKVPAITFKDIYRLEMNQQRIISGKTVYGPSLRLVGLTNSQINTGHAFLIHMIFQIKYNRNIRNLEEEKKIPTICILEDSVDESDEVNKIEYDCIGNLTKYENEDMKLDSNYKLNNIQEDHNDNTGLLDNNNFNELAREIDIENLSKTQSSYTLDKLLKTSTFSLDEIKNITSNDYKFNFTLNGKLNRQLNPVTIDAKLPFGEIEDKKADCLFIIKENKKADLSCEINTEEYKEYKTLSFKVSEIGDENNPIYLAKINEIYLINEEEAEEESEEKDEKDYKALIIGLVCGGVGLGIVVTVIIILVKRYKKKKNDIIPEEKKEKKEEVINVKKLKKKGKKEKKEKKVKKEKKGKKLNMRIKNLIKE